MLSFILTIIGLACTIFSLIFFLDQYIAEKKGRLFIIRPSDSICAKIARRSAELEMDAEEYIIYAIEGDEINVRCRENRPHTNRHSYDLPSRNGR